MAAPNFLREVYFLSGRFFLRRGKRKSYGGLYQENRVDVLENSHHVLSKMVSHFWPCDLRRCHSANKYHRYRPLVDIFGRILQAFSNFFLVKPCIR